MRFYIMIAAASSATSGAALAQNSPTIEAAPITAAPVTEAAPPARRVTILRDTPVNLMADVEITTANVTPGTRFKLRVNQPIIVDNVTIVPVGATAYGEVVTASASGGLGKTGKMTSRLLYIALGNAEIPLEGDLSAKGTGGGSAGVAVIFAGVSGLFHRGNNAKIKAGELINGFVREDIVLNLDTTPITKVANTAAVPVQQ